MQVGDLSSMPIWELREKLKVPAGHSLFQGRKREVFQILAGFHAPAAKADVNFVVSPDGAYKQAFDLAVGIAEVFKNGEFEEKQGALLDTRSNLTLKDKKINVQHDELFSIIIRGRLAAISENKTFEPANWQANKRKNTNLAIDVPSWLRTVDRIRIACLQDSDLFWVMAHK